LDLNCSPGSKKPVSLSGKPHGSCFLIGTCDIPVLANHKDINCVLYFLPLIMAN